MVGCVCGGGMEMAGERHTKTVAGTDGSRLVTVGQSTSTLNHSTVHYRIAQHITAHPLYLLHRTTLEPFLAWAEQGERVE